MASSPRSSLLRPHVFVSRYLNVYDTDDGNAVLFQSLKGALSVVDGECGRRLEERRRARRPLCTEDLIHCDVHALLKAGHLTRMDPSAELEAFKIEVDRVRRDKDARSDVHLWIIPTYRCNLSCPYCFQTGVHQSPSPGGLGTMSVSQVDRLFETTAESMFGARAERLRVHLFGGEPLLAMNGPAIRRIVAHTRERELRLTAVTNGTQIHQFLDCIGPERGDLSGVVISLDGPERVHDKTRVPISGRPTYGGIMDNVELLLDRGLHVQLNLNLAPRAVPELPEVAADLRRRGIIDHELLSITCVAVQPVYRKGERGAYAESLSELELALEVEKMGLSARFQTGLTEWAAGLDPLFSRTNRKYDNYCPTNCSQANQNTYHVDLLDDVYSCPIDSGYRDKRIGVIAPDGTLQLTDRANLCRARTVANVEECSTCSLAMACGGGCAAKAEKTHGTILHSYCNDRPALAKEAAKHLYRQSRVDPRRALPVL